MKPDFKTLALATMAMSLAASPLSQGILSANATRFLADHERELKELKQQLVRALPEPDQRKKAAYLKAREAEAAALDRLAKARNFHQEYGKAQGLVGHAKNHWIRQADKGIAKARKELEAASTKEQRKAAEESLANWEKNRQNGQNALEERQAMLDKLERDKPKADRELKEAKEELAQAKEHTLEAMANLGFETLLTSDRLDGALAKYSILKRATPRPFANYASKGREEDAFVRSLLEDEDLLIQIAVADGPRNGNYERAVEIYHSIQKASDKAAEGTLQRLALAIALEHAKPISQRNANSDADAPTTVDPLKRYLHFEKAFLNQELDPAFGGLDVWHMRMVVDGSEPDEILAWGRDMLRNYRPDHITTDNYAWRYVAIVRSDVPYGSQDNKYDKDELQFFQNILMNGGVCGRRAFIGRFILRAFGIPTTARPSKGHAALAHWTPKGWVVCLGGGWGAGWTKTRYKDDLDFLATTQARATGGHFLRVKRAYWIGDLEEEPRVYGLAEKQEPGFWNGVALYTQRALIESAETLEAVGEDIAEASDTREKIEISKVEITDEDRKIRVDRDGIIIIPAAATSEPASSNHRIMFLPSVLGGKQLHYSRGAGSAEFEYVFSAPKPGTYALTAKVVTPSWQQNLMATVNDEEAIRIPLPHTVGLWDRTEAVAVELKRGRNKIRFRRHSDGSPKGFSIKSFKLVPWEDHLAGKGQDEAPSAEETTGMPKDALDRLNLSLLRAMARVHAEAELKLLPMDLTVLRQKVQLVKASGSGMLDFQMYTGEFDESAKTVTIAMDDLSIKDHAMLSQWVVQHFPKDPTAHARAALYMEAIEDSSAANYYIGKAGEEHYRQFRAEIEGTSP